MLSIIICAYREEKTIKKAVDSFVGAIKYVNTKSSESIEDYEIIVSAPDKETLDAVRGCDNVVLLQDEGRGKPDALNEAMKKARGDVLVFSDGDVYVDEMSLYYLLKDQFDFVTGRPVGYLQEYKEGVRKFENKYDYWQFILTDTADRLRQARFDEGAFLLLSGYLYAVQKKYLKGNSDEWFQFPNNTLAEDEYLSYWASEKKCKLSYAQGAKVYVKYPDNYRDWLIQKSRTLGATLQLPREWKKQKAMRSFGSEVRGGFDMIRIYVCKKQYLWWFLQLGLARLHAWLLAFWQIRIARKNFDNIWRRVESTK